MILEELKQENIEKLQTLLMNIGFDELGISIEKLEDCDHEDEVFYSDIETNIIAYLNKLKEKYFKFNNKDLEDLTGNELQIQHELILKEMENRGMRPDYDTSRPTKEEILEEMQLHNNDEVGENDKWTFEDAEYYLLNSDKYHYANKEVKE